MKRRQPRVIFISKEGIATFWFAVAASAIIGGAVYAERLAATKGIRPQFIGMNTEGTLVRAVPEKRSVDPDVERELQMSQTRLLADSVFNKSANGLDSADRCQRMMAADTWQWVQNHLIVPQSDAFKEGRVHQKVAVDQITVETDDELQTATATLAGQLIRTGILEREIFNQVWKVKASIVWERNTSLRDCGRFPLLCTSFIAQETPVSSTQRHLTMDEESSINARAAATSAAKNSKGAENPPAKP